MRRAALYLCVLASLAGCGAASRPEATPDFEVSFRASGDDGMPLSGVVIQANQAPLGTTNDAGKLTKRLKGAEGQVVEVTAVCPDAYEASEQTPPALRLTRTRPLGSSQREPITYDVVCQKRLRQVAIVVKSERGADLPVSIDGKRVGTTDGAGNAHALVELDRTTTAVRVDLETTRDPRLQPQNPQRTFELHGRDAVLIFEQPFTLASRAAPRPKSQPIRRHVPQRLD
jgi:hypothetical protein